MCSAEGEGELSRTSRAGEVLTGRFVLEHRLGSGGTGAVYRAVDRARDVPVAVKLFRHGEAIASARFEREASVLAELRHPHIVGYVAHGTTDAGERYLVTELVAG
jgi:serine/threonine protein kinase